MKTSRIKRATTKKVFNTPKARAFKNIKAQDLRLKLSRLPRSVVIILDDQEFSVAPAELKKFVAIFELAKSKEANNRVEVLSTQEVADLLNVSRPYVVKLIDSKKLRSHSVGSHRRVLESDALEFKQKMRSEQNRALDELAKETEDLGLDFK